MILFRARLGAVLAATMVLMACGDPSPAVGTTSIERVPPVAATDVPHATSTTQPAPPPGDCRTTEGSDEAVDERLAAMSLRQKIGQLFMPHVYGATATEPAPAERQANEALYGVATAAELVSTWGVGGVLYIERNTVDPVRPDLATNTTTDPDRSRSLSADLQAAAAASGLPGLLVAVDQEGGPVQRFGLPVPSLPAAATLAASRDPAATSEAYRSVGAALRDLGVNVDFAPVADVTVSSDGVIGERSFGATAEVVVPQVVAALTGLQEAGVAATAKHFPGHGGTTLDSHLELPVLATSEQSWNAVDRPPFAAAVDAGVCLVMTGHLAFSQIEEPIRPATLSPTWIDGRLRDGLGFTGVVVTDSLFMGGVRAGRSDGQVAVEALQAGVDLLLMPPDLAASVAAIEAAVSSGEIEEQRLDESVRRVLTLKAWLHIPV